MDIEFTANKNVCRRAKPVPHLGLVISSLLHIFNYRSATWPSLGFRSVYSILARGERANCSVLVDGQMNGGFLGLHCHRLEEFRRCETATPQIGLLLLNGSLMASLFRTSSRAEAQNMAKIMVDSVFMLWSYGGTAASVVSLVIASGRVSSDDAIYTK